MNPLHGELVLQWLGGLRWLAPFMLLWLAFVFGRTLRAGATPLIEQVARRGTPAMPMALRRYTRGLTAVWCGYFVVAATATAASAMAAAGEAFVGIAGFAGMSLAVWGCTALLFVGERLVRPFIFPGEVFPSLWQQLLDTCSIWRPRSDGGGQQRP